jgi:hypothetical protein
MKHLRKSLLSIVLIIPFIFSSCSKDDAPSVTALNSKIYDLGTVGAAGVSGKATFIENSDATVSIELELLNTPQGGSHPAHIHLNNAADGGAIALTLKPVDGTTGKSTTTFRTLDNGSAITYQALLDFDGYINVHLSADNLALVAQGDIGQNELTGKKMNYVLAPKDVPSISGTVELAERNNGTTLVTIKLVGTGNPPGGSHPAHIHDNMSGDVIAALNDVNGDTGISKSQVANLVGGAPITYTELLALNAYVNVHLNDSDAFNTIVAQGNIGSNVAVAESKTYSVTANGTSSYVFNGEGLTNSDNPNLTFKRGGTYKFNLTVPNHPFFINMSQGTGTARAYGVGVTSNGAVNGTITFTVPMDAPDTLYYNCQFHPNMNGTITITN